MAIHQEITIAAPPSKVYDALTNSKAFAKMTGGKKAEIAAEAGGQFSMFDGAITGRHVELVPGQRVVQAWRSQAWPEGVYSIVKFELSSDGGKTHLVFDQSGYPDETHDMLTGGWHKMYWEPMAQMLAG